MHAICCSIFSSVSVLMNCVLMLTWLPAATIIREKMLTANNEIGCLTKIANWFCFVSRNISFSKLKAIFKCIGKIWKLKQRLLVESVIQLRFLWIILLTLVACYGSYIVFYDPKLQLPDSDEFQLFRSTHVFEQYDMIYKNKFWYKRSDKVRKGLFYFFFLICANKPVAYLKYSVQLTAIYMLLYICTIYIFDNFSNVQYTYLST